MAGAGPQATVKSCAGGGPSIRTPQTPYNVDPPLFPGGGASPSHLSFYKGHSEGPRGGPGVNRGHTGQVRKARTKLLPSLGSLGRPGADSRCAGMAPGENLITTGTRVSFCSPRGLGVQITVLARDPSFLHLHFLLLPLRRINPRPLPSPVPRI